MMRTAPITLAIGLLLVGGGTLAQRAATSTTAGQPATTGLTAGAQKLQTAYGQALEGTRGRATKADWAKYVGTTDSEYQKAATHMPRGMAVTHELKDATKAAKAGQKAADYRLSEAMRALRASGAARANRAGAEQWVQAQDQQLAVVNTSLANRSAEIRRLSEKGDREGAARIVGQVGADGARALAKQGVPGAPETRSAADQQKSRQQYTRLMNQLAKKRGVK